MRSLSEILAAVFAIAAISACSSDGTAERTTTTEENPTLKTTAQPETTRERTVERTTEPTVVPSEDPEPSYGYTYGQASGNLVAEGEGSLPLSETVDVSLEGSPAWVAGVPFREGVAWVVALEDGSVQDFYQEASGGIEPLNVAAGELAPNAPPLLATESGSASLVASENDNASNLTHPAPLAEGLLTIAQDGEVFVESEGSTRQTNLTALPDARIVENDSGTVAFLSSPTRRYAHDVLGDGVEAGSITVADLGEDGELEVQAEIIPESSGVFEEVSPIWTEADENELLAVSESADGLGSRVSLYTPDGRLAAAGPFIGEPFKWRHVLAAGPFGPNGEFEVAAVRTPHLSAVVEFYRPNFEDGTMEIVAEISGYTSHRIYTRNLDTARAGDMSGDGRWELLVPDQSYTQLVAIRRSESGAEAAWTLSAGGEISTNIASATDAEGRISAAAGRSDGTLRIWR